MPDDTTKPTGRYARILLDYFFKRSFGTEGRQRLLTLLLQEIIPERTITSLRYAPQEHVNPTPEMKGIRVDVECTDQDGTRFVVEMQLAHQDFFYERAVFNSTFAIQEQIAAGVSEYDFPSVYFIGILNFSIHKETDQVLFRYQLRERDSHELMTDRIQYLFLELTNCHRALSPEATVLENFCYALHNMENLPDRPKGLKEEIFTLLFESAEIAKFAPKDRIKYEYDMRTERDIKNQIAYARKEGREEGREEGRTEGRAEGRAEGRVEIAQALLELGVSRETIEKATGLSSEQLSEFQRVQ